MRYQPIHLHMAIVPQIPLKGLILNHSYDLYHSNSLYTVISKIPAKMSSTRERNLSFPAE